MITHPRRVWLKGEGGWFSREKNPRDAAMEEVVSMLLTPGAGLKLTEEERKVLNKYNEDIAAEGYELEAALKLKYGNIYRKPIQRPVKKVETAPEQRSTRSNASYSNGFRAWMRRTFGV